MGHVDNRSRGSNYRPHKPVSQIIMEGKRPVLVSASSAVPTGSWRLPSSLPHYVTGPDINKRPQDSGCLHA